MKISNAVVQQVRFSILAAQQSPHGQSHFWKFNFGHESFFQSYDAFPPMYLMLQILSHYLSGVSLRTSKNSRRTDQRQFECLPCELNCFEDGLSVFCKIPSPASVRSVTLHRKIRMQKSWKCSAPRQPLAQ